MNLVDSYNHCGQKRRKCGKNFKEISEKGGKSMRRFGVVFKKKTARFD